MAQVDIPTDQMDKEIAFTPRCMSGGIESVIGKKDNSKTYHYGTLSWMGGRRRIRLQTPEEVAAFPPQGTLLETVKLEITDGQYGIDFRLVEVYPVRQREQRERTA